MGCLIVLVSIFTALGLATTPAQSGSVPLRDIDPAPAGEVVLAQTIIRERVIIRVPTRMPPPKRIKRWKTKSGPKCISGQGIGGALVVDEDKVDLILPGGQRIRAELENSCPALDYYSGFYLRPDPDDGMICARREAIHARSGGECQIKRFRRVIPVR